MKTVLYLCACAWASLTWCNAAAAQIDSGPVVYIPSWSSSPSTSGSTSGDAITGSNGLAWQVQSNGGGAVPPFIVGGSIGSVWVSHYDPNFAASNSASLLLKYGGMFISRYNWDDYPHTGYAPSGYGFTMLEVAGAIATSWADDGGSASASVTAPRVGVSTAIPDDGSSDGASASVTITDTGDVNYGDGLFDMESSLKASGSDGVDGHWSANSHLWMAVQYHYWTLAGATFGTSTNRTPPYVTYNHQHYNGTNPWGDNGGYSGTGASLSASGSSDALKGHMGVAAYSRMSFIQATTN